MWSALLFVVYGSAVYAKLNDDPQANDDPMASGDDPDDSGEHIGAMVAQAYQFPYAATLMMNDSYVCSATILNNYWLLTLTKCFDTMTADLISSYVTHKNLGNFTIRAGSSYNNKAGIVFKIKMLVNNFDYHVTAIKLETPMQYTSQLQNVRLPERNDDASLGYLASIIAWTPTGHMRMVNAPVIDPSICERNTKMLPGHYICLGGVQDPNRHFCRKDHGGAVIQNNTLIAIASFINPCALYSKTHAFPKVSSLSRWLDSLIWDENNRPTTAGPTTTVITTTNKQILNATARPRSSGFFGDPSKYMLTLPFDPVNVPLEPAEDNSVLPGYSLYESYLQSIARSKISTELPVNITTEKLPLSKMERKPIPLGLQMYSNYMPKRYDGDYN